jgi:hypothetical protein
MGPRQLLLEFVGLMPLLSGFRCLLETSEDLLIVSLEVWDCFLLAHKHLGRLRNILQTRFVLFAQLTELSTAEEKLEVGEAMEVGWKMLFLTLYLSDGWEELKNCRAASTPNYQATTRKMSEFQTYLV